MFPATVRVCEGAVVPMPTFPEASKTTPVPSIAEPTFI